MPKHYSKSIFLLIALIFIFNTIYFVYSSPSALKHTTQIATVYKERPVNGAIQPLPLISSMNEEWVILGRALFHSTLLSADNSISCASCHHVNQGGADIFPVSLGIKSQPGARNSPTVFNASLNFKQFWDGRSNTLSEQILGPIHNPVEMGSNFNDIIQKLNESAIFKQAFNSLSSDGITEQNIVQAITAYEESLLTYGAPIDEFLLGDENALTESQKRGLAKFEQLGCSTCHQGRNIGGNLFQKIGRIDEAPAFLLMDKGRYEITKKDKDLYVFRVPSLRNVALTAPYFHNGSVNELEDAVKLMGRMQLGLTLPDEDVSDIVALLNAFTGNITSLGAGK